MDMPNTNRAALEKQLLTFSRQQAREAGKLRAAGLVEAAAEHVRRCSTVVEQVRSQARKGG